MLWRAAERWLREISSGLESAARPAEEQLGLLHRQGDHTRRLAFPRLLLFLAITDHHGTVYAGTVVHAGDELGEAGFTILRDIRLRQLCRATVFDSPGAVVAAAVKDLLADVEPLVAVLLYEGPLAPAVHPLPVRSAPADDCGLPWEQVLVQKGDRVDLRSEVETFSS